MNNFWQHLNKPFTILAPMANVTDWAFRQIIIETGRPDVFYTEFISAAGIHAVGHQKFKGELFKEKNEHPIVAQFFGSDPHNMYRCARLASELGFDGIDINMGCPDASVEKQGAGAALMKNFELALKIIKETIRGAGDIPVSVKTRLGYNKIDHDWIKILLDSGIQALAVHARTRKEMSKVPAHWDEMEKISKLSRNGAVLIGNGDIKTLEEGMRMAEEYGLDGIMVGRGIFENPWLFSGRENNSPSERISLLRRHVQNFEKLWGGGKNFDVLKRFFKIYIHGWPGAKDLRTKLMNTKSKEEVYAIIDGQI